MSRYSPGPVIEMEDMRDMYRTAKEQFSGRPPRELQVATQQQVGQLALQGLGLTDRNPGNVMVNRMTGRPIQIDFGLSKEVAQGSESQIRALANATTDGLYAAGLTQESAIFEGLVDEYLKQGDLVNALNMAKQGFSRLQKIKPSAVKARFADADPNKAVYPLEGTNTRSEIMREMMADGMFTVGAPNDDVPF